MPSSIEKQLTQPKTQSKLTISILQIDSNINEMIRLRKQSKTIISYLQIICCRSTFDDKKT